ncbi:hypothetical protein [Nostoc sp. UHCC 0251]|uniref:hypothetical protein n=1 Tax=Nostoc sp. UHCC 0251 TaxID=3110240 RepID=UPI002B209931|nr:hypothetical protein [Nostoc sp. UHCC 0251]MEA5628103.1 hypothetical protein [Nostoc sp. UHCC 0251]
MTYTTHTQQAIPSSSVDEQALAQAELYTHLESQAEAVAPTQDPLTARDRRIIGEIIEVEPESVRTIWIEGGITVWVQLVGSGRLPFDRNWFATTHLPHPKLSQIKKGRQSSTPELKIIQGRGRLIRISSINLGIGG